MKVKIANTTIRMTDIAAWTGGRLVVCGNASAVAAPEYICTDSREGGKGVLFCAIRGERVDGHDYMPIAYGNQTHMFLCEKIPTMLKGSYVAVVVDDTVEALSYLAGGVRDGYLGDMSCVAVTGSVGKTTTKECIAAVLSRSGRIFKKEGNFNSVIGLPLSMLEIAEGEKLAVLEMGMSAQGEIRRMSKCVRPNIAVITNIGSSHLEHLGSRENISRAKLEIREGLRDGGVLLIDGDEPLLMGVRASRYRVMRVSVGGMEGRAEYKAVNVDTVPGGMRFDMLCPSGILEDLFIPGYGVHMVWAAAYASAVGLLNGMSEEDIRAGLADYRPAEMRQNIFSVSDVTFIEDCYNAAPESMLAALSALMCVAGGRRIAVLGSMLKLGDDSVELHRAVGEKYASVGVDLLVCVGELGAQIAEGARTAGLPESKIWFADKEDYSELAQRLAEYLIPGDTVIFKASRAMQLELLVNEIKHLLSK